MAGELPPDLAIEQVWAVEASYGPDARERRPLFRAEHLGRIGRLRAEGRIVEAGGFLDWSGALLLVRAPDADSAIALVADDVYTRNGIWGDFRARPYGRVIRRDELPQA